MAIDLSDYTVYNSLLDNSYDTANTSYALVEELLEPFEEEARREKEEQRRKERQARSLTTPKTLLDRMTMTQKEYMKMLAIPRNPDASTSQIPRERHYCFRCGKKPYPVVQLSIPGKLTAFDNWKQFGPVMPTEMIRKFDDMWRNGHYNLEPKDVRYYLRQVSMIERNIKRRRRRRKKKKRKKNKKRNQTKDMSLHQSLF